MRRDHKIREREAALKATESELAELKALKESLGKDPYATIEKFGGSIEDWSNRLLQTSAEKPRDPAVVKLEKELAELRQWREQETQERSKRQESETRAQQERTMAQFRSEIDDTLSKSDELKALHIAGLGGEVQEVIRAHALKTQEETGTAHLLGIDEAAKYVKAHYLPKLRETLQRLLSLPEFADVKPNAPAKAHTPAAGNGSGDGEASQELEPYSTGRKDSGPNTLTNKTTAIAPPRGQVRGQSSEERWASLVKKYVG
jgi:NADH dehydrogenase/NADH:ubiquinone oxidoreductase subunit G